MRPADSARRLRAFARTHGIGLTACMPREGIGQMLAFYREVRVEGCDADEGDMLLFQWGTYDWGRGPAFELDITRQFIELHPVVEGADDAANEPDEDSQISQLSLTFRFATSPELDALGVGNRWCQDRDALAGFEAFVLGSAPLRMLGARRAAKVTVLHDRV